MKIVILPNNPRLWETNNNCLWCETVDILYNQILNYQDEDFKQKIINILDENYIVDGYKVLTVFERWGLKNKISEINDYNILEYEDPIDQPNILFSCWCGWCGSRKPDIIEE